MIVFASSPISCRAASLKRALDLNDGSAAPDGAVWRLPSSVMYGWRGEGKRRVVTEQKTGDAAQHQEQRDNHSLDAVHALWVSTRAVSATPRKFRQIARYASLEGVYEDDHAVVGQSVNHAPFLSQERRHGGIRSGVAAARKLGRPFTLHGRSS